MTRDEVLADCRAWLGTKYVHQASVRGEGCDCLGLVGGIARDRGTDDGIAWANDEASRGYGTTPNPRQLITGTEKFLDHISISEAGLADILLMRFQDDPQHFAIITALEPTYITHASRTRGRVVEHRLDAKWRERVMRAYRYRGIE